MLLNNRPLKKMESYNCIKNTSLYIFKEHKEEQIIMSKYYTSPIRYRVHRQELYKETEATDIGNRYLLYPNNISKSHKFNKLELDKLGHIGIDRFKMYTNIKSINLDIIPNKSSLGIVRDNNGLEVLDISTGEYLNINKYNYTSIINACELEKDVNDVVRYKIEIKEIANVSDRQRSFGVVLDVTAPRVYYGFIIYTIYILKIR